MPANTKRVFHVKYLSHRVLADVRKLAWPHCARRFERAFGFVPGQAQRLPAGG